MTQFQILSKDELMQSNGRAAVPGNGNYGAPGTGNGYATTPRLVIYIRLPQVNTWSYQK